MSNLSLFGQTLSNVTSFTLPTTGGSTATYTEGGITPTGNINITQNGTGIDVASYATASVNVPDSTFVVTLSWDDNDDMWIPDKTFTDIRTAYSAGKDIVAVTSGNTISVASIFDDGQWLYTVYNSNNTTEYQYAFDSSGIDEMSTTKYDYNGNTTLNSNGQLLSGVTVRSKGVLYTGNIPTKTSSDLSANGATVTVASGYYASQATKQVASGTAGTPTATKGSVSNHAVSVTPSVTNTTGYITGSTINGTAVSVSASELVSGNLPITQNGSNIDVTNYATVSVDVSGSSGMTVGTATATPVTASSSISFTGLQGEPTSFYVVSAANLATGASPYKTAAVVFDGTNLIGQYITNTSNAQMTYSSSAFSKSYSSGTLTITGTASNFQANQYKLVYTYGGSSANIGTESVQVGSGATSITFTGLSDEPTCFACIFTDNIGTSSGYTRAHVVVFDGSSIYGMEMGSGSSATSNWTKSYSSGSLTITSTSTSAGGYFHQPGYYELVYGIGGEVNIDIEPLNVTENGTYSESGKAYSPVVVQVSGGGTSKNTQVIQATTRVQSTALAKASGELTVSKTGTYHVYWSTMRTNTSSGYTWGSQLYVGGSAYGSENTSGWSNNVQNIHLTNVSLTVNQKIQVYARGRSGSYYAYVPTLVIVEA